MNFEEKCALNNCQEKPLKYSDSKIHSEVLLSPTRRSSRIRKPKISVDYCNIDEAIEKNSSIKQYEELPVQNSKRLVNNSTKSQVKFEDNIKETHNVPNSYQSLEKNNSFFQTDTSQDESFESMFDDIFGQTYTKTLQKILPKKFQSDSSKERKFFKRKQVETSEINFSNSYITNKSGLPTEDVNKVFKIISKPNILSEISVDSKSCGKPSLKTYSNKRKNFQKNSVVESFGLPDYPIIHENGIKPITNNKLDAEVLDASEITILDLQYVDEPWIITNIEGESLFPYYEEVRIKAEPVKHDAFRMNSSFLDIIDADNCETCELNFFTSTPLNSTNFVSASVKSSMNNIPKNVKTTHKNKEIDIEAIKMNFKKILSKRVEETNTKSRSSVLQNRKRNRSKNKISISSEISFVESDSLTIENKEIEIANSFSSVRKSENDLNSFAYITHNKNIPRKPLNNSKKKNKTINISIEAAHNKTKARTKFRSSVSHISNSQKQLKAERKNKNNNRNTRRGTKKNKKAVKYAVYKNSLFSSNLKRNIRGRGRPETKLVEASLTTMVNYPGKPSNCEESCSENKTVLVCDEKNKNFIVDEPQHSNDRDSEQHLKVLNNCTININKKKSQVANAIERSTNSCIDNEVSNNYGCKELILNNLIVNQIDKPEVLEKNIRSSNIEKIASEPDLSDVNKQSSVQIKSLNSKIKKSFISNTNNRCKRLLRSSSQENVMNNVAAAISEENSNKPETTYMPKKRKKRISGNVDVCDVNIKKCNVKTSSNNSVVKRCREKSIRLPKTSHEPAKDGKLVTWQNCKTEELAPNSSRNMSEHTRKISPLKKCMRSMPEIKIVIIPLDLTQILPRVPEMVSNAHQPEIMSPTRRSLRSYKTQVCHAKLDQTALLTLTKEKNIEVKKTPLEYATHADEIVVQKDPKEKILKEPQPTYTRVSKTYISDSVLSDNMKKLDHMDTRHETEKLEIYLKNNEDFVDSLISQQKYNSCKITSSAEGTCESVETTKPKLKTDCTKTDNSSIPVVPNEEATHKSASFKKAERHSSMNLECNTPDTEQNQIYEGKETLDVQNREESSRSENRKEILETVVTGNSDPLKPYKQVVEININDKDITNNDLEKDSKLHQSSREDLIVEVIKKNVTNDHKLEINVQEADNTFDKNDLCDQSHKTDSLGKNDLSLEMHEEIINPDNTVEPEHESNINLLKINDIYSDTNTAEINLDFQQTNETANIDTIVYNESPVNINCPVTEKEKNEDKFSKPNENTQTIESSENVENNFIPNNSRLKETRSKFINDKTASSILEDFPLANRIALLYNNRSSQENQCLKQMLDNHEVNQTKILTKLDTDKLNNSLSKKRNGENVEVSITNRVSRGRLVDHKRMVSTKKIENGNRVKRSKSVAPQVKNDNRRITRSEIIRDTHNDDLQISDKSVKELGGVLKKSKSFTHFALSSNNKADSTQTINTAEMNKNNGEEFNYKSKHKKPYKNALISKYGNEPIIKDTKLDEYLDFQIGDLAWAQIGYYPFWPCLITEEPETGRYKKIVAARGKRILYHVRFFGDKGRRAWINRHQIMLYCHQDDLKFMVNKLKNEKKNSELWVYIVKSSKLEKWQNAVNEAELLKSRSIREKLSFFNKTFKAESVKGKQLSANNSNISLKHESLKRKRKEDIPEHDDNKILTEGEMSPLPKKLKRCTPKDTSTCNQKSETDMTKKEVTENNDDELVLSTRLRIRNQTDNISEIDSKTSSKNTINVSLYSMDEQKALFKRNNLFKGISRDKVCQYCLEPGEVLKCKGRCNGSYHVICATKILKEKVSRKGKKKRVNKSDVVQENIGKSCNSESTNKSVGCEKNMGMKLYKCFNSEYNLRHSNKDKSKEMLDLELTKMDAKRGLLEEDHVQIITVPSSVYNTPPRKTFPPDFKNMTLAEQIDYKMKEIMKKFESKTVYAESSTDSSLEENAANQPQSNAKRFSRCVALFPISSTTNTETGTNLKEEKKIKEEYTKNYCMENSTTSYRSTVKENTLLNTIKEPNANVTRKPFIRHVTADFDTESIDEIAPNNILIKNETSIKINTIVDPKNFKCGFCLSDLDPFCFICNRSVSKKGSNIRQKCSLYQCGRFYHPECLKLWPQTQWSLISTTKHKDSDQAVDSFVCPLHVCHTCASDDPRAATSRCSADKIVKCLRCPSTYHSTNLCVPAGSSILSSTQILCPRHREKLCTINTTWCFLCSEGGNLICCETCPTSVHPECLPVNLTDDDKFICEDCESGRLPLYDEIVWVKLGQFRWWPALILFPNEVPVNVMNIKHSTGEFVVKFFGTYDYYWVSRGRSFLFQEGDTGRCNSVKRKVDAAFNKAVEEAVIAHKLKREFKQSQEAESVTSLKPPPYIRIKVNKPVGNVRQLDLDLSSTTACDCDPSQPHPCGPDSDCLNRLLLTECNPDVCPAGKRCKNQSFEKREYPPLVPYKTQGRGWGLKTLAPIRKGQFVIEYVGELIDIEEYQRRIQKMHEQKEENYYFLTIDKDRMLDAGPKGNAARFMNHCCQPNCETQKWTVNGDTRVGLFATEDIPADTELTFNYNLECVGKEKKVCRCGAPNCSGFIGVKAKQDTESKKPKKSYKKKKTSEPVILPPCFICGRKGSVGSCNNKICNKAYHLNCLQMKEWPEGNKFICPWHNCNICSKRTIRCCVKCVSSFCPSHSDGNIRYDNLLGFVCSSHDPTKTTSNDEPVKWKKNRNSIVTDETAVTSTTSDDIEDDEDDMPLLLRIRCKKAKRELTLESESENESYHGKCDVIIQQKEQELYSEYDSQDEGTVSSATLTDAEDEIVPVKRKRGRPRKKSQSRRKDKLCNLQNHNTANCSLKDSLSKDNNSELINRCNELENR